MYIYIYICRRGTGLSTFWPFWKAIGCPPFCQNLIFTAGRSILRGIGLATWKAIGCPLLVAIFDPKMWTTYCLSRWPTQCLSGNAMFSHISAYLGLFLKNQNLNWKANGHIGGQPINFQKFSMFFFGFFLVLVCLFSFFFVFFLAPFFMFLTLLLRNPLMLACKKQTNKEEKKTKKTRKKERKQGKKENKKERKERKKTKTISKREAQEKETKIETVGWNNKD